MNIGFGALYPLEDKFVRFDQWFDKSKTKKGEEYGKAIPIYNPDTGEQVDIYSTVRIGNMTYVVNNLEDAHRKKGHRDKLASKLQEIFARRPTEDAFDLMEQHGNIVDAAEAAKTMIVQEDRKYFYAPVPELLDPRLEATG